MSFGSNLVSLREAMNISRKELAERLKIPYTTLRNYETDQREPGHKLLIRIATMFSVSVDDLIGNPRPETKNAPSVKDEALLKSFHRLNDEGKEKLLDYADDLVASGRYAKESGERLA